MKYLIFFLLLVVQMHGAKNRTWSFERINLYLENDAGHHTDIEYSDGARFSVLMHRPDAVHEDFHIPFTEVSERTHFISFALTRQMFTPDDRDGTASNHGENARYTDDAAGYRRAGFGRGVVSKTDPQYYWRD